LAVSTSCVLQQQQQQQQINNWAHRFHKVLNSASDSSIMPDAVTFLTAGGVPQWSPIDVDQATKAFHRHSTRSILNVGGNPRLASSTAVAYWT